jgi:hypothetical protein
MAIVRDIGNERETVLDVHSPGCFTVCENLIVPPRIPRRRFACARHVVARRIFWMHDRIVIDLLKPCCTAVSLQEIAAGAGLSLAETRQAVASLVAKGVLVVQPGGPAGEAHSALNLVRRPTRLRIDR